jgi:predicted nucleotidyltransferase
MTDVARFRDDDVILVAYRGSIAHGTHIPSDDPDSIDDVDYLGVFVPPLDHYFGIEERSESEEFWEGDNDVVLYELVKFVRLMAAGSPNVLAALWVPERLLAKITPAGRRLVDIRRAFLSKDLYLPLVGYAHAQLKKMTHGDPQGFRSQKRKELIDRFGYDCKSAQHAVRLLRMGLEALQDGEVRVVRPDAEELVAVKSGRWSLARVQEETARLFDAVKAAWERSPLPEHADWATINRTVREILHDRLLSPRPAP